METNDNFYLGRIIDPKTGDATDQNLLYDPADLTTHAVVVGMTGSGKTGLCVDLLEEAALNNIPALMIDPKGDITNTLLHFPDLLPGDFQPWVNPDEARREGLSLDEAAEKTASLWKSGLEKSGIFPDRIQALKEAAQFTIYTPGSTAGIPLSILNSLKAPGLAWEENQETLREMISGTVTALLGLAGLNDIDPVRSREHILLANIFEHTWSQGRDLDLGELIIQTQTPPFDKLGVFDVDTFFPQKERFDLAMSLNNILAAPSFEPWVDGQPLDIPALLYEPDGRPRHSVFYIAHLPDAERMFFVTLLFSAVETWMRAQSGTTSLRGIVYFDEIFGYLPPVSNPPSKEPMLRMLKQARAFGIGLVLVTQNPVDVDYKALSNAGTWFIGKLQTEKDKERLLDGLQGATSGSMDRGAYDKMISSLGKRAFLLHNVHERGGAQTFFTRWAMNYLAGPLTRTQIPALNELAGAAAPMVAAPQPSPASAPHAAPADSTPAPSPTPPQAEADIGLPGSSARPAVPTGFQEYFLPHNLTLAQAFKVAGKTYTPDAQSLGLIYHPELLAQATVRFLNRKYGLDHEETRTAMVMEPDRRGMVRWEDHTTGQIDERELDRRPDPHARFGELEKPLTDGTLLRSMRSDFEDWAYQESEVVVRANETLKVYAGPGVTEAEFRRLCSDAARDGRDEELKKVTESYDSKVDRLVDRLKREQRELADDEAELSQRKMEEFGTHAETVLSLFQKRRRSMSSSLSKRRMTSKAKADVEESIEAIKDLEEDIADLKREMDEALEEVNDKWGEIANKIDEITVHPYKKDVHVDLFGVAWAPYHLVQIGKELIELPGYGAK